ncbi:MAG TPA: UDP-glucuronic acid decarboxylase family protein [Candidatus Nitrosotalea sp.]|nr:UDP-glucuronic acid decarboxylase family protein [Candidatus Nitrosotalea sp.]
MVSGVLITGAAGFVGSHLVDRYLRDGASVIGVDNLLTGSPGNLAAATQSDRFELIRADVASEWREVHAAIERSGSPPELILHFASPASPIDYFNHPVATMAANSAGTNECLKAAKRWNCRFLYASTSESYGDPLVHPQREDYWGNVNPVGPRSCYDESKRFGEALTMAYVRSERVDARIIRIFNTYGPRMRPNDGRVVSNFILEALRGQPLTIYGDGLQTRSFCYVDDLVEGIVRCAASEQTRARVVNLGNPQEYTIAELARLVSEMLQVPLNVENLPAREDDPGRRRPDITVARELLGWEPHTPVADGLRRTIEYFQALVPGSASNSS